MIYLLRHLLKLNVTIKIINYFFEITLNDNLANVLFGFGSSLVKETKVYIGIFFIFLFLILMTNKIKKATDKFLRKRTGDNSLFT